MLLILVESAQWVGLSRGDIIGVKLKVQKILKYCPKKNCIKKCLKSNILLPLPTSRAHDTTNKTTHFDMSYFFSKYFWKMALKMFSFSSHQISKKEKNSIGFKQKRQVQKGTTSISWKQKW